MRIRPARAILIFDTSDNLHDAATPQPFRDESLICHDNRCPRARTRGPRPRTPPTGRPPRPGCDRLHGRGGGRPADRRRGLGADRHRRRQRRRLPGDVHRLPRSCCCSSPSASPRWPGTCPDAGAFYTYIGHGLGRHPGSAPHSSRCFSYTAVQGAVYGYIGAASTTSSQLTAARAAVVAVGAGRVAVVGTARLPAHRAVRQGARRPADLRGRHRAGASTSPSSARAAAPRASRRRRSSRRSSSPAPRASRLMFAIAGLHRLRGHGDLPRRGPRPGAHHPAGHLRWRCCSSAASTRCRAGRSSAPGATRRVVDGRRDQTPAGMLTETAEPLRRLDRRRRRAGLPRHQPVRRAAVLPQRAVPLLLLPRQHRAPCRPRAAAATSRHASPHVASRGADRHRPGC